MDEMINETLPQQPTQEITPPKSGMAIASLILGVTAFIPLLGVFTGIVAIILSVVASRDIKRGTHTGHGLAKAGKILGILGILFSVVLYGSLFYFGFVKKDGPFSGARNELNKQLINQNAGALELYKKKHGKYPEKLEDLAKDNVTYWPADHYMNPFYYKVSTDGNDYELRGLGPDGEYGTSDDLLP